MPVEIVVPTLGESITEAVIGKWNKQVGDAVALDESVAVLETDKVTVEVNAPAAGVITRIDAQPGSSVKVGAVIASIDPAGVARASSAPIPATNAAAVPAPAPASNAEPPRATPVARNVLEDKGLDPSTVRGSGAGGKIRKDDVLAHAGGANGAAPAPAAAKAPPPAVAPSARANASREERVKMTPLRRRAAERLLQAQSTAAILTTFNEVDMGAVMELRKRYQERFTAKHGIKLGFMSFFVRAAVEALKAFPVLNGEIDGDEVVFKHYYDIGVAVAGTRGLVVPVVRDADQLSLAELEKAIADLGGRARSDKLTLGDLQGGTFTITNGGIFGSMLSTPILNPPQTGILGMHNIQERALVKEGQIVVAPVMYLALSYDHRLVDGKEAVQFLVRIKDCLEDPQRLLLDV